MQHRKKVSKSKQKINVTVLTINNGGRRVNFKHQAEKDKTHRGQKGFTSKEQKENVRHFQEKDKKCKKIKEDKNWTRKGRFGFPCHANQFDMGGSRGEYLRLPCGHYHLNHQCVSL